MKRFVITVLAASALSFSAVSHAHADEVPVDRVILSTSGLANFVHKAQVTGNKTLEFPVRFEQVDDILKSLIVFDKKGRLGGVTLPGRQPLDQVFKDLPFSRRHLAQPMMLLNAYQGAGVTLTDAEGATKGKLLQVVPEKVVDDEVTTTRHRISVMTAEGMRQKIIEDLQSLQFDDSKIRAEITRALDAVRENGTAERRTLSVSMLGEGERDVTLSYVVDAPLWKTAYRLVVPETGGKNGLLQGWAVVENMTASDWDDVDFTLVSGNPVTFRQNLYQSYYVTRPEIPVEVFGRVMPRLDSGVVATAQMLETPEEEMMMEGRRQKNSRMERKRAYKAKEYLGKGMASAPMAADAGFGDFFEADNAPASLAQGGYGGMHNIVQAASAALSAEATTQVLFRFPDRFSLKSGQSMMLPFVSRDVPMERVSLYQPETHTTHPLAAVELKNDGKTGLPPGVLTLYEESKVLKGTSFVGDAQLPVLAQGEKRMVSYALDSKTTISRDNKSVSTEGKIAISQGVMRRAVTRRMETDYTVKAPAKEERVIVIEHPKQGGYKLISPNPKDVEVTQSHYRIRVPVKPGETRKLPVVLENEGMNSYSISGMSTEEFVSYTKSRGKLSKSERKQFANLVSLRRAVEEIDIKIRALDKQRQTIFQDQERVRQNIRSLSGRSQIYDKYLKKLNAQETQVEKIDAEKLDLAEERQERQAALDNFIMKLTI